MDCFNCWDISFRRWQLPCVRKLWNGLWRPILPHIIPTSTIAKTPCCKASKLKSPISKTMSPNSRNLINPSMDDCTWTVVPISPSIYLHDIFQIRNIVSTLECLSAENHRTNVLWETDASRWIPRGTWGKFDTDQRRFYSSLPFRNTTLPYFNVINGIWTSSVHFIWKISKQWMRSKRNSSPTVYRMSLLISR